MLQLDKIIQVALNEHPVESDVPPDPVAYTESIIAAVNDPAKVHRYSRMSPQLSLVSFDCMLQDTGYPMEVYLPASAPAVDHVPDLSSLQERWVGWGVELPGAQPWLADDDADSGVMPDEWPLAVRKKYPLSRQQSNYLGALIKIYDNVAYAPASRINVTGVLSTAFLPQGDSEDLIAVPAVHVLRVSEPEKAECSADTSIRSGLLDYLADCFEPKDAVAAELLLLNLLSSAVSRQPGHDVLGTLSINLISPDSTKQSRGLIRAVQSISPLVVSLPLSVSTLHQDSFLPHSSDSTSLESGLLQLCQGTVLCIQEGEMGEGGNLEERAVKNLQALVDCLQTQTLQYVYPYMDNLRMDCDIRGIVFSEGKSLIPVDLHVPIAGHVKEGPVQSDRLSAYRSYLLDRAGHGAHVVVPDEVAQRIQEDFVAQRQSNAREAADKATDSLRRQMRIARAT